MSNWCVNTLWISYESDDKRGPFLKATGLADESPRLDLNAFLPEPERFRQMDRDHLADVPLRAPVLGDVGGDLLLEVRGAPVPARVMLTKYGDFDIAIFETAWKPPIAALRHAETAFPGVNIDLHFAEMGMAFAGNFTIRWNEADDGKLVAQVHGGAVEYRGRLGG